MLPLKSINHLKSSRLPLMIFRAFSFRVVLPRPLRKSVRFFSRLMRGEVVAPCFSFFFSSVFLFLSLGLYGCYLGGHFSSATHMLFLRAGFELNEIQISGNQRISDVEIFDRLNIGNSVSLIDLDLNAMHQRLSSVPWIKSVSIRKMYPDRIRVELIERVPFAVWQNERSLMIVESSGDVIAPFEIPLERPLPFIVGNGAALAFPDFFEKINKFPDFVQHIKSYIRVGGRRWNLQLHNNVVIKLPEKEEEKALSSLISMDKETALLSRDILNVDLRSFESVVVQLSPQGLSRYHLSLHRMGIKTANSVGERT